LDIFLVIIKFWIQHAGKILELILNYEYFFIKHPFAVLLFKTILE
jgi:hypothetical protein